MLLIQISQEQEVSGDRLRSPLFFNDLLRASTAHDALGNTKLLPPLFQQGKQTILIHIGTLKKINHTSDYSRTLIKHITYCAVVANIN